MPGISVCGGPVEGDKTVKDFVTLQDRSHTILPHAHARRRTAPGASGISG